MSEIKFFQTRMGRQYYEVTMPELVRQITRLNDLLALAIELTEIKSQPEDRDNDLPSQD